MLHDNGQTASSRIIIFATDDGLQQLTSKIWYINGNFKLSPPHFQQLYVIRDKMYYSSILLTTKQNSYEHIFKILIEECAAREIYLDQKVYIWISRRLQ